MENVFKKPEHLLEMTYGEIEEKNLEMKKARKSGVSGEVLKEKFLNYLKEEKGIKAVTVCFSDLEGKLHTLDYDKNFLVGSHDNLTFDGSSIHGFTAQSESDLRLGVDFSSIRFLPADLFGAGKVLVFANVMDKDGSSYVADFRGRLADLCEDLRVKRGILVNIAPEIEGFLFKGVNVEQIFSEEKGFELATMSGYFSSLPQDTLRLFIDKFAEVQRVLGFENEKDHPEVAPAQFELNYRYTHALESADQVVIYKLIARQVASMMGLTACFLPKPIQNLNGSGMHTNMSFEKDGKNIFYGADGKYGLSAEARRGITGILYYANDLCLIMNPSVNSYRRLDPAFEAPNEIKVSSVDRGSMVRIPIGNEKSARVEVRTVAPDANPYLCFYAIVSAALSGIDAEGEVLKEMEGKVYGKVKKLPGDIETAIELFEKSKFMAEVLGKDSCDKYVALKRRVADRSPRALGGRVKNGEVLFHHEITNQSLWANF
ncbi:MAG: glutamine synthetase family protein [Candidatus Peregrinibacteria bacterium]|nr:glutamine synthetase family protein [Candidatus Peregrinibacteria bacterium]